MGRSIEERKKKTIADFRKLIIGSPNIYERMEDAHTILDLYIDNGYNKTCKCGVVISNHNRTGMCRACYLRKYRKKDEQKRLEALRARYYRKRKKVRVCESLVKSCQQITTLHLVSQAEGVVRR